MLLFRASTVFQRPSRSRVTVASGLHQIGVAGSSNSVAVNNIPCKVTLVSTICPSCTYHRCPTSRNFVLPIGKLQNHGALRMLLGDMVVRSPLVVPCSLPRRTRLPKAVWRHAGRSSPTRGELTVYSRSNSHASVSRRSTSLISRHVDSSPCSAECGIPIVCGKCQPIARLLESGTSTWHVPGRRGNCKFALEFARRPRQVESGAASSPFMRAANGRSFNFKAPGIQIYGDGEFHCPLTPEKPSPSVPSAQ